MKRNVLETALGGVVLLVAAIFLAFAFSLAKVRSVSGYQLTARFDHVSDVRVGGDVELSGIKVGSILSEDLDPKTYQAVIKLTIDNSVKLPEDSQAVIASSSLLGENHLSLVPGGSDKMLNPGDSIKYTQSPASLQSLLGQVVFSLTQNKPGNGSGGAGTGNEAGSAAPVAPTGAPPAPTPPRTTPTASGQGRS